MRLTDGERDILRELEADARLDADECEACGGAGVYWSMDSGEPEGEHCPWCQDE